MGSITTMTAAALLIGAAASTAQAAPRGNMALMVQQIDQSFVCPEALPDDAARKAALDGMAHRMAAKGLNYAQGTAVLRAMLTKHRCAASAAAQPVAAEETVPAPTVGAPITLAAATPQ